MSYQSEVLADSPVAYWRLADLTDSTAGARTLTDGSVGHATSAPSLIIGGAATDAKSFDTGQTNGLTRADDAGLSPTAALTLECWIKPTAGGVGVFAMDLVTKGNHKLSLRGTGIPFYNVDTNLGQTWTDNGVALAAAQTYHLVGTTAGGTHRLYINGAEVSSTAFGATLIDNTALLIIGGASAVAPFWGVIDEVAFYNTALAPARVLAHYSAGTIVAGTTATFEATLLSQAPDPGNRSRGRQAGANYKLRQAYLAGVADPTAHTLAKNNPQQLAALTAAGNLTAFDAITAI